MPEGPEIELMRRGLLRMEGQQLNRIVMHRDHRKVTFTRSQLQRFHRVHVREILRVGKVLCIATSVGQIVVGAGMSGGWRWVPATKAIERRKHDIFSLECSNGTAIFNDARRFGSAKILIGGDPDRWAAHLGLDGLTREELTADQVRAVFAGNGRREIKPALLDQSKIAGIGNIYASEICHRLGVHPQRRMAEFDDYHGLGQETYRVLTAAVGGNGATIKGANPYRTPDDEPTNGLRLRVYGRTGEPCTTCRTLIQSMVQAARTSYWCPTCQPD